MNLGISVDSPLLLRNYLSFFISLLINHTVLLIGIPKYLKSFYAPLIDSVTPQLDCLDQHPYSASGCLCDLPGSIWRAPVTQPTSALQTSHVSTAPMHRVFRYPTNCLLL